jgi:hypothetical protein
MFGHYLLCTLFNRMIRDSVLAWGSLLLVIVLAFILMPTYERFKDASGKEVDVSPNAPPVPDFLKPQSGATKPTTQLPSLRPEEKTVTSTPPPPLPPAGSTPPVTVKVDLPPPSTNVSNIPSGVRTLPSQSMPADTQLQSVGANTGLDKQVMGWTLPGPSFQNPLDPSGLPMGEDKYVLKSSLIPFACGGGGCGAGSQVPGGNDGMVPTASGIPDDGIKKPFSEAFDSKTEPEGYLNSFAAFMK